MRIWLALSIFLHAPQVAAMGSGGVTCPTTSQFRAKLQEYMTDLKAPALQFACQGFKPDPNFKVTDEKLNSFYADLFGKVRRDLNGLRDFNEQMGQCLNGKTCTPEQNKLLEDVRNTAQTARHLLAYNHALRGDLLEQGLKSVVGGSKIRPWQPLTHQEMTEAEGQASQYTREIETAFDDELKASGAPVDGACDVNQGYQSHEGKVEFEVHLTCAPRNPVAQKDLRQKFTNSYVAHELEASDTVYRQLLGNFVILQYVSDGTPSDRALAEHSATVAQNIKRESDDLAVVEDKIAQGKSLSTPGDFRVLEYRAELERSLLEHPENCQLATALLRMNAKEKNQLDAKLLMLTSASLILPPVGAVLLTGGVASFFIFESGKDYGQAVRARMTTWKGDKPLVSQSQVDDKKEAFWTSIGQAPLMVEQGAIVPGLMRGTAKALSRPLLEASPVVKALKLRDGFGRP